MKLIYCLTLCGLFVSVPMVQAADCACCQKTDKKPATDYYIFEWKKGEKLTLPPWIPES